MSRRSKSATGSRHRHRHGDESEDEEMPIPSYVTQNRRKSRPRRSSEAGPSHRRDTQVVDAETQGTQRANANKLPPEEETHLVASVIRYLFVADRSKTIIQRAHIVKNVLPDHSKHYKQIMTQVPLTLQEVFGYNLVELEGSKYILTNNIENSGPHLRFSANERKEQILCFIVLSHIFMCGQNGCTQEELYQLLRSLEIIEADNFIHEYFGDVKVLITDKFVKQGYLDLVTVDKSDPPIKHYQWGPRAENELTPRRVLEFMSKIFGGRPLNTWTEQFNIMQDRENLNEEE